MKSVLTLQVPIVLLFIYKAWGETDSECQNAGKSLSYLDVATDMITKARVSFPVCSRSLGSSSKPVDCEEILRKGHNTSGVYTIWPRSRVLDEKSLKVFCDMVTDGGGWIVIQRRGNYSRSNDYFFKDWESYKNGFGDIEKDFWLGNDNIFALTNQRLNSIRFDLKDVEQNTAYAVYDTFWIDDENNQYTLHIKDYSGNAGDSMIVQHDNQKFSTKDRDNDNKEDQNCAQSFKGGWWYNTCHHSNLNGLYLRGAHESFADGVNWLNWKGYKESLDTTEMKIRPKNFRKDTTFLDTPTAK